MGHYPFGLTLSPDGNRLYVVNSGMFVYTLVEGYDPKDAKNTGLEFPPFGFPSEEAHDGVTIGDKKVAGLGDPNVIESFSLWALDISDSTAAKPLYKVKQGLRLGKK